MFKLTFYLRIVFDYFRIKWQPIAFHTTFLTNNINLFGNRKQGQIIDMKISAQNHYVCKAFSFTGLAIIQLFIDSDRCVFCSKNNKSHVVFVEAIQVASGTIKLFFLKIRRINYDLINMHREICFCKHPTLLIALFKNFIVIHNQCN